MNCQATCSTRRYSAPCRRSPGRAARPGLPRWASRSPSGVSGRGQCSLSPGGAAIRRRSMLARQSALVGLVAHRVKDFGGEHVFVAAREEIAQHPPSDFLAGPLRIHVRRVKEGDAQLNRSLTMGRLSASSSIQGRDCDPKLNMPRQMRETLRPNAQIDVFHASPDDHAHRSNHTRTASYRSTTGRRQRPRSGASPAPADVYWPQCGCPAFIQGVLAAIIPSPSPTSGMKYFWKK